MPGLVTLNSASPVQMLAPHCRPGPVSYWAYLGPLAKLPGPFPQLPISPKAQQLLNPKFPRQWNMGAQTLQLVAFICLLGGETQGNTTAKPQFPHLHCELV